MRFRNYLEDMLGTKVRIKVLRELHKYPTKVYTIRELASSIKDVTHAGVRKAVIELRKSNAILMEHHGQSNNIVLNRKSAIYDEFKTIFEEELQAFEKFRQFLAASATGKITSMAIFGSIAKRSEVPESDIDLVVISSDKEEAMRFIEAKASEVMQKYGNVIIPIVLSRKEFQDRRKSTLVNEVLEKYIMVMGEDIWELTR
ncbi:nucleotidyltransferase domain-containing protein [Candidatus Woesearchaeota archaeon]|nr:nucleotidyltransferase domain-containing protein [Candidatus Woesearchaeota archaeon]